MALLVGCLASTAPTADSVFVVTPHHVQVALAAVAWV